MVVSPPILGRPLNCVSFPSLPDLGLTSIVPAIRLRLFGGASLEGAHGPIAGRGAQRRRIALLAIIAAAGRAVSRDKLVGLLWEEADTEKARKLLSESLYVLRKTLGEDALLTAGDTVEINRDVVVSDVADFRAALARGDDAAAVEHYAGPFLDGFFVGEAAEFDNWMEGERAAFARMRAESLQRLAAAAEASGNYATAAGRWRMLVEQDRFTASYAIGLMRALDAAGDRVAALQHARTHAALLQAEFGAGPDEHVEAFALALQNGSRVVQPAQRVAPITTATPTAIAPPIAYVTSPAPVAVSEPDAIGHHPATVEHHGAAMPPRHLRRWIIASSIVAVAAAVLIWQWTPGVPTPEKGTSVFVVIPFSVHGADVSLGEGIVDLLRTGLDGAGDLRGADQHAVLNYYGTITAAGPTPRQAKNTANHFLARYYVTGDIVQAGTQMHIAATLTDNKGSKAIGSATVGGEADNFIALVDDVARQLLATLGTNASELTQVAAAMTRSTPALRQYITGDKLYNESRYGAAVSALLEAVKLDPGFALADYRMSAAAEWNFDFQQAEAAAKRATQNSERLPDRYSHLVFAWGDFLSGNVDAALRGYNEVLARYPNDVEARAGLGEVLIHFNPTRGISIAQARGAFDRVKALAPAYGEVRFHLLEFAARKGDLAAFDSLYTALDSANPQFPAWRAVRTFRFGTDTQRRAELLRLAREDQVAVGIAAARVAANSHDFQGAAQIAGILTTPDQQENWQAGGHLLLSEIAVASGDWARASSEIQIASRFEHDWTRELEALFALHPDAPTDRADLLRIEASLRAWQPSDHTPELSFFLISHTFVHRHLRFYLLGLVKARLGDFAGATSFRQEIEGVGGSDADERFAASLSQSLAGHIARAAGDRAKAIEMLREAAVVTAGPHYMVSPFYSRAHDRLVLGDLNREVGNNDEARRWYESLLDGFDFAYVPAATARLKAMKR